MAKAINGHSLPW